MIENIFISLSVDQLREIIKSCVAEELANGLPRRKEVDISDELLTVEEAAGFLNLAVATLYEKTSKKLIPHFKKGKRLYFKHSALLQWITAGDLISSI